MKKLISAMTPIIVTLAFIACGQNDSQDSTKTETRTSNEINAPLTEVIEHYLHMKNALVNDNSKEAASAGQALAKAIEMVNTSNFNEEQKKAYGAVEAGIKEHAEYIGASEDDIADQRGHFDLLSKDMYELVKVFGAGKTLYKEHCPMYNDNKGAIWLSEEKEIRNPYYGKKMLRCGSVQEELK